MGAAGLSGAIYVHPNEGSFLAHVAQLPGCVARGATREEAVARVREAYRDYLALLGARGAAPEKLGDLDPATFDVREPADKYAFPEDAQIVHAGELADLLRRYDAVHAEVLAAIAGLDQERLERSRGDEYSVRQCLEHIMATEVSLLSRLEPWPAGEFAAFKAVHRLVAQRFGVMGPDDTVGEHRIRGQRWTARRVMRRVLEHQYEHLRQIREILSAQG